MVQFVRASPASMSEVVPAAAAAPDGSVARNAVHLAGGQLVATLLAIVANALLARSLGPADFGLYYLVSSITAFAYVFVDWGQGSYLIREVARRHSDAGRLLGSAVSFRFLAALVVCLVPTT